VAFSLAAVDGALVQTLGLGRCGGGGGILRRPGGQSQRGSVGVAGAACGGATIGSRENSVAAFVDLNTTTHVGVQAVDLSDDSCATFGHAALNVVDWISADIPGARDRFRGDAAVGAFQGTTPQIRADGGVAGAAAVEIVTFLVQRQIVDTLSVADATDGFSSGTGPIFFAVIERVGAVEHAAHIVGFAVHLAFRGTGRPGRGCRGGTGSHG